MAINGEYVSVILGCVICTCLLAGQKFKTYGTASVADEMEQAAFGR